MHLTEAACYCVSGPNSLHILNVFRCLYAQIWILSTLSFCGNGFFKEMEVNWLRPVNESFLHKTSRTIYGTGMEPFNLGTPRFSCFAGRCAVQHGSMVFNEVFIWVKQVLTLHCSVFRSGRGCGPDLNVSITVEWTRQRVRMDRYQMLD